MLTRKLPLLSSSGRSPPVKTKEKEGKRGELVRVSSVSAREAERLARTSLVPERPIDLTT